MKNILGMTLTAAFLITGLATAAHAIQDVSEKKKKGILDPGSKQEILDPASKPSGVDNPDLKTKGVDNPDLKMKAPTRK